MLLKYILKAEKLIGKHKKERETKVKKHCK